MSEWAFWMLIRRRKCRSSLIADQLAQLFCQLMQDVPAPILAVGTHGTSLTWPQCTQILQWELPPVWPTRGKPGGNVPSQQMHHKGHFFFPNPTAPGLSVWLL